MDINNTICNYLESTHAAKNLRKGVFGNICVNVEHIWSENTNELTIIKHIAIVPHSRFLQSV